MEEGRGNTSSVPHMAPDTFSPQVERLLDELTIEEQVSMLAGSNMWNTVPVPRLDIPKYRVSDGPAGVRGSRFDGPPSMNVPCGTAIAATWDRDLVRSIGELLGREVQAKGARVHLAPTVNLHRTPVGGRNFECMSEDPLLTAITAVEYVKGVQSQGVASCIKHFVANDTEFERMTIDSQVDERTLRETYLVPFERAVTDADVMSVMSAYNRVNGPYAADSVWLLREVLREEWGFAGMVVSDWYGLHSTAEGVLAGCDLEMPGPALHRGDKLLAAVHQGQVPAGLVRECVGNILSVMERTGGLHVPPGPETSRDDADDIALLRRSAAASFVLLKNDGAALPLGASAALSTLAVIGPNAATGMVMGGGSAHVTPTQVSHPLNAINAVFPARGVEVRHAPGCNINKKLPELDMRLLEDVVVDYFATADDLDTAGVAPAQTGTTGTFRIMWSGDPLGRRTANIDFGARISCAFTPDVGGTWKFSVESVAPVRMFIDDVLVLDNSHLDRGGSFFGMGKPELICEHDMTAGATSRIVIEVRHHPRGSGLSGLNIGAMAPVVGDQLRDAVDLAAQCDATVLVVGTNNDWESEGWDRETLDLPGRQDELIAEVAKVSKRTIVVVNAGSPVAMPWLDAVDAVLFVWFPGQQFGDALADVLTGAVDPGGRLPVTLPRRLEDTPAFEHHPGRNGEAKYLEGRLIGYRWFDTVGREPLFPFGHGLGYSDITIDDAAAGAEHMVNVTVTNHSDRDGDQVVQVYAHRLERDGLPHDEPDQVLVGFVRVRVAARTSANASVLLDERTMRTWDATARTWSPWRGPVQLRVGTSSRAIARRLDVTL